MLSLIAASDSNGPWVVSIRHKKKDEGAETSFLVVKKVKMGGKDVLYTCNGAKPATTELAHVKDHVPRGPLDGLLPESRLPKHVVTELEKVDVKAGNKLEERLAAREQLTKEEHDTLKAYRAALKQRRAAIVIRGVKIWALKRYKSPADDKAALKMEIKIAAVKNMYTVFSKFDPTSKHALKNCKFWVAAGDYIKEADFRQFHNYCFEKGLPPTATFEEYKDIVEG